ncbi:MAG: hypothetical protein JW909_13425 [Planctomycetes bacterium]|nr:hypothetical protein [Planctomycetota bacterium]
MIHVLLWLLALAAALLFTALAAALAGRIVRYRFRLEAAMAAAAVVLVPAAAACVFSCVMLCRRILPGWLFPYTLGWTAAYAAAMAVIFRRGGVFHEFQDDESPPACAWPRLRLAVWFAALLAALYLALRIADIELKNRMQVVHTESTAVLLSLGQTWIPPERNAALLYERAFERFGDRKALAALRRRIDDDYLGDEYPAGDAQTEEVSRLLAECAPATQLIREAAGCPDCWHGGTYDHVHKIGVPHLAAHQVAANLLRTEARRRAAEGDAPGAYEDVVLIRIMAEHISRNPSLIAAVISFDIDTTALYTLEDILADCPPPPDEMLLHSLRRAEYHSGVVQRAMRCERAGFAQVMARCEVNVNLGKSFFLDDPGRRSVSAYGSRWTAPLQGVIDAWPDFELSAVFGGVLDSDGSRWYAPLWRVFMAWPDFQCMDRNMQKAVSLMEPPLYRHVDERAALSREALDGWRGIVSSIAMLNIETVAIEEMNVLALHGMADAGIAATLYERDHGAWPSALGDLVPEYLDAVPIDPFDGAPVRFISEENGIVLYCLGRNFLDDGGCSPAWRGSWGDGDDLIFCLGSSYLRHRREPSLERIRKMENRSKNPSKYRRTRRRAPAAD